MIIDADVHLSPYREDGGLSPEYVVECMDRAGVDKALCWLQPPYIRLLDEATEYIRQAALRYPDRFLPFGWADPRLGVDDCVRLCGRCLKEYGFYGMKLNGAQNDFSLADERIDPIIECVAGYGKVLALHIGDENNNTHPMKAARIAQKWPELPILMVHMGGAACNMEDMCIEAARDNPNMFLVGSSVDYPHVLRAIRTLGAERVLFGSDVPFSVMEADAAGYRAFLRAYCTPDERELVMGGNIRRILKIGGVPDDC